jgi:hypothetical protein
MYAKCASMSEDIARARRCRSSTVGRVVDKKRIIAKNGGPRRLCFND